MPLISIIVPVLNEQEQIVKTLKHLAKISADFPDLVEIIVVDGGSSDDTVCVASDLSDVLLISPKGRAIQMNLGAKHAKGDYLLFLHADTLLPECVMSFIQSLSEKAALWGFFPVRLSGQSYLLRMVERCMTWRSRLTQIATGDQAIIVARDFFLDNGSYPNVMLMEDVALSKVLKGKARPMIAQKPVITSSRRWERKGILKTICLMWLLRFLYFGGVKPKYFAKFY